MKVILHSNTDVANHIGKPIKVAVGVFVDDVLREIEKEGILTGFNEDSEYIRWTLPDGVPQPVIHKSCIIKLK